MAAAAAAGAAALAVYIAAVLKILCYIINTKETLEGLSEVWREG